MREFNDDPTLYGALADAYPDSSDIWRLKQVERIEDAIRADERKAVEGEMAYRRCATCRWAEVRELHLGALSRGTHLVCDFITNASLPNSPAAIWDEYAEDTALAVQPSFGCVQWQAKGDPAPEEKA